MPTGAIKLQGTEGLLRVRVGDYRIIYQIIDHELVVMVVKVGHRREVYRA
jgi:mRNA interferase RelE/StbE